VSRLHLKNTLARLLVPLGLAAVFSLPARASDEAVAWLQKMGDALRQENYDGIFSYMRGSTYETIRIVHRMEDGVEKERLFNLNGEVRELYREDDEIICLHPESDEIDPDHTVQIGPFTPAFSERVLATQDLYRLAMHGTDRIAGREAVKLSISPSFNDRYGYRLWLDAETGLMLQSHLVERGRVREIFQFSSLKVGSEIEATALASAMGSDTSTHRLTLDFTTGSEKPVWRVRWLPDGFRPVRQQGNRLHFSDGVATLSVFVEGAETPALPEMATTVGGTVVITRRFKPSGSQITVVGEVPVQTARKVAESVEPVIY